MNSKTDRTCF